MQSLIPLRQSWGDEIVCYAALKATDLLPIYQRHTETMRAMERENEDHPTLSVFIKVDVVFFGDMEDTPEASKVKKLVGAGIPCISALEFSGLSACREYHVAISQSGVDIDIEDYDYDWYCGKLSQYQLAALAARERIADEMTAEKPEFGWI